MTSIRTAKKQLKAITPDLTPAEKRRRTLQTTKTLAKLMQERMYTDAIVAVWTHVERMTVGLMIKRRGRKITKKDETIIAWTVKQAETVRDAILASAPEAMRPHIIAAYKAQLKLK
mgnify:CR=1 FL=1